MAFCHCFFLVASTPNVSPFPMDDLRLPAFKQMCEELKSIVKENSGVQPTCFMSYAWPQDVTSPLRSWFDAIHEYLTCAGINVLYDVRNFTGDVSQLEGLARSASKILILLTPDYKAKCDKGTTLRNEIRIAFSKGIHNRSLVLLSGSVEKCLPFEDIKGAYIPGNEMINLMVPSDFRDQKSTDGPCIEKFYGVICSLLYPTNQWGLLQNMGRNPNPILNNEQQCCDIMNRFLASVSISVEQPIVIDKTFELESLAILYQRVNTSNKIVSALPELKYFFDVKEKKTDMSYLRKIFHCFNTQKDGLVTNHYKRCVLTGKQGVGKRTLATKYAHLALEKGLYEVLFWIDSSHIDKFTNNYIELANKIAGIENIPGVSGFFQKTKRGKAINIVSGGISKYKTLLVFANIPTDLREKLLYDDFAQILDKKLPSGNNCHILMTSEVAEWGGDEIKLQPFSIEESVEYLCKKLNRTDKDGAKRLAEKLECLPSRLSNQVIKMESKNMSFDECLEAYIKRQEQLEALRDGRWYDDGEIVRAVFSSTPP
ncbi:MAG: hypothetical protein HEEMFOPI_01649 [Holosporales bacterium]